ncbi:MAG: FtsX-like permease family protein, partial [Chloroflexota bacterium]
QFKLPETNAQIGDLLTLETPAGETRQVRLVGVVADQTVGAFSGGPGFFLAPVQGYTNRKTAEWLGLAAPYRDNAFLITIQDQPPGAADDPAALQQVGSRVRDELERIGLTVVSLNTRGTLSHPNLPYVEALSGILNVLGVLVLFLSGFLITNTLQAIVQQQIQQIGILKTLGSRRYQIIVLYMALILVFGLLAAALAIPLAYQVAFERTGQLTGAVNVRFRGARLLPSVMLLQLFMGIIVPQAAALLPILQGARHSVSEALSGIRQGGEVRRSRIDQQITRLRPLSRPMLVSLRNTFRRKGRLALTLVTLSLGGAIFISTFNMQRSMDGQVDLISRYFLADANLFLTEPHRISEIQELLEQIPGVEYVEGWGAAYAELLLPDGSTGPEVQILAPPVDTRLVQAVVLEGRWVQPGDSHAIALNDRFRIDYPDIQVGDPITLRINGKEIDWTIIGFFKLAGRNSGLIGYTSFEAMSAATNQPSVASAYRIVAQRRDLSPAEQDALGVAIDNRLQAQDLRVADLTTGNFIAGSAAQGFSILNNFLLFLAILTAIVGSIGLAGTMSLNILERTREIGILRAIGATDGILMKLVIAEGMIIGGLSWIISALLALPISKLLSDNVSTVLFGSPAELELTPTGFLLWLGLVTLLSVVASIIPDRSAAHLTIREVLAYE